MEWVVGRKMLIYQCEEFLSYVGCDRGIEWRVEPDDFALSWLVPIGGGAGGVCYFIFIFELKLVSTVI